MMFRTLVRIFLISFITSKHYLVEVEGENHQERGWDYSVPQSSQSQGGCGQSNAEGGARIVGGKHVKRNEYPWHVRLSIVKGSKLLKAPCGGSILTRDKILTAAHCTVKFPAKNITVWTGEHDYKKNDGEMSHAVCNKTEHPEYYKKAKYDQDIAVLHLCQPLIFSAGKF